MNDIIMCKYEIVINALEQIFKTNEDNKYAEMLLDILENMYDRKNIDINYIIDISELIKKYNKNNIFKLHITYDSLGEILKKNKDMKEYINKLECLPFGPIYKEALEEFQSLKRKFLFKLKLNVLYMDKFNTILFFEIL